MGKKIVIVATVAWSMVITLSGCSMLFMSAGAWDDVSKPDSIYVLGRHADIVKLGKTIRVTKINGDTLTGENLGVHYIIPTEDYRAKYAISNSTLLIGIGSDTVRIPTDEIERIQWRSRKYNALTGFILGACIDAAIIIAGYHAIKDLPSL